MSLDTIGRGFGEQGGVPDYIKSMRCVLGDGSDLMMDVLSAKHGGPQCNSELAISRQHCRMPMICPGSRS